jgi:hypothetical protein
MAGWMHLITEISVGLRDFAGLLARKKEARGSNVGGLFVLDKPKGIQWINNQTIQTAAVALVPALAGPRARWTRATP